MESCGVGTGREFPPPKNTMTIRETWPRKHGYFMAKLSDTQHGEENSGSADWQLQSKKSKNRSETSP